MGGVTTHTEMQGLSPGRMSEAEGPFEWVRDRPLDVLALTFAVGFVPISIAVAESFLAAAIIARAFRLGRGQPKLCLPRVVWY